MQVASIPSETFTIMGIVNITPDSFSDGGKFLNESHAVQHCLRLTEGGADIIDLGCESTRPGSLPVSLDTEWKRLQPVLQTLKTVAPNIKISVDTRKSEIMLRAAQQYKIHMINDTSGVADLKTLQELAKQRDLHYLAMHTTGPSETMQASPLCSKKVVPAVTRFFEDSYKKLLLSGFSSDRIWFDPGIGFGKTDQANLMLMSHTSTFAKHYQLAYGVSRKSIFGRLLKLETPSERDNPSKVTEIGLCFAGAKLIRTHSVESLSNLRRLLSPKVEE